MTTTWFGFNDVGKLVPVSVETGPEQGHLPGWKPIVRSGKMAFKINPDMSLTPFSELVPTRDDWTAWGEP